VLLGRGQIVITNWALQPMSRPNKLFIELKRQQLWEHFEVRFRAEKYGVPYFLAESGAKQSDPRKEAAGARARNAVENLSGGHRREALGVSRLSRRRYSCNGGRPRVRSESGVSQTRYRSDFKRTWVR
jgi:hypothetical protein